MDFKKYQHIERLGDDDVEGITKGTCYVFYKIDGTNGQVYLNDNNEIECASRNKVLTLNNDNQNFCAYIQQNGRIKKYLKNHMNYRLYGEWLTPHRLKTYKKEAWNKFYIFDITKYNPKTDTEEYIPYEQYKDELEEYNLDYIPAICKLDNPTNKEIEECLQKTGNFLIEEGKGEGEGIVIKNYDFINKFGDIVWAKIVNSEFKKKRNEIGRTKEQKEQIIEEKIVINYCTEAFVEKEFEKIKEQKNGWSTKYIKELLSRCYSELIKEESYNFIKKYSNPTINFSLLNKLVIQKVKDTLTDIF